MTANRRGESWGPKLGRALLAASVAGGALAVGTVHTVTLCIVTIGLAAATVAAWWSPDGTPLRPRRAATLLLVTGVVLTVYTALQCIPMPIGLLAKLAPHNADVWARALRPLRESGPTWAPISLDPTATRIEVLKGVAYVLAFVTSLRLAQRRSGVAFLSGTVILTGAALAAATLMHPAFGAKKLYGVFAPSVEVLAYERHVAPFLNPNNLASYLNVAFCLALAAAIAPQPRMPRPLPAAAAVLFAGTQVWVASRGGVATMVIGALLVLAISRAPLLRHRQKVANASLVAGVAVAGSGIMLALGASERVSAELFDTDVSKLALVRQALRMVGGYPLFGVGRGAFETAFPAFRDSPGQWTYTHPENVIAQWIVEWGVPVGVAGLAAIAFGLRPNTVLARSSTAAGAWAALVAVGVQSLVDLGSEIPGLMLAPVICAAIVVGGSAGREPRLLVEKWTAAPRKLAIASAAVAISVAAFAIFGTDVRRDRTDLREAATAPQTSPGQIRAQARGAILRHPAEPYLPFIVGWRASHARDDDPFPWLEATLERARVYGPAHLVLARLLAARSPSQARLEYRLSVEQAPELDGVVSREEGRLVHGYYDAMELVQDGKPGVLTLQNLSEALRTRLPSTSVRLDEEIASRAPRDPGPSLRTATSAVEDLETDDRPVWCDGAEWSRCLDRALTVSNVAVQLAPALCEPYLLRARARIAAGSSGPALDELSEASNLVVERVACLRELVGLAQSTHDSPRATAALTRLSSAGCVDDAECAENLEWIADAEQRIGNTQHALALYRRACDRTPDDDALLEKVATLASSAGLHTEAARSYEHLARKHPTEVHWRQAADSEHDMALRGATAP